MTAESIKNKGIQKKRRSAFYADYRGQTFVAGFDATEDLILELEGHNFLQVSGKRYVLTPDLLRMLYDIYDKKDYTALAILTDIRDEIRAYFEIAVLPEIMLLELFGKEDENNEGVILTRRELVARLHDLKAMQSDDACGYLFDIDFVAEPDIQPLPIDKVWADYKRFVHRGPEAKEGIAIAHKLAYGMSMDRISREEKNYSREWIRVLASQPRLNFDVWTINHKTTIKEHFLDNEIYLNRDRITKTLSSSKNNLEDAYKLFVYQTRYPIVSDGVWGYSSTCETIVLNDNGQLDRLERALGDLINNRLPFEGQHFKDAVKELLNEYHLPMLPEGVYANFIAKNKIVTYPKGTYRNRITLKDALVRIQRDYFPQGIDTSSAEDLDKVNVHLTEDYRLKPRSKRALTGRIQTSMYLVDSATYADASIYQMERDLYARIVRYVNNLPVDRITHQQLYKHFQKDLDKYSNITNTAMLHGYLKSQNDDQAYGPNTGIKVKPDLIIDHYYVGAVRVLDRPAEERMASTWYAKVEDYLYQMGRPVKSSEILEEFPGVGTQYINYAIARYNQIVFWKDDQYFNLRILNITPEIKSRFREHLETGLKSRYKYTNAHVLYTEIQSNEPSLLEGEFAVIDGHRMLFYVLRYMFEFDYFFTYPHILRHNDEGIVEHDTYRSFTTGDLLELVIETDHPKTQEELERAAIKAYGQGISTMNLTLAQYRGQYRELEDYLYKADRPMELDKIETEHTGSLALYIRYAMEDHPQIVRWENDTYYNVKALAEEVDPDEKIYEILEKELDDDEQYTSAYTLFERVKEELGEDALTIEGKPAIDQPEKLFYVLRYHFLGRYFFTYPHIVRNENKWIKGKVENRRYNNEDFLEQMDDLLTTKTHEDFMKAVTRIYGGDASELDQDIQEFLERKKETTASGST